MNTKTILCVAASALSAAVMASDTPEVSNVTMTQASVGRKVTITYELRNAANGAVVTLDIETNKTGSATNIDSDWVSIGGAAVCNAQGDVWEKVSQGSKTITWRPDHSWEGHKVELANGGARAVVTAWALDNTPDYMVVDITVGAQPNTQRYYPSVDFLPGGVANGEYKTTTLLMRKIMAKDVTWTMGSTALETRDREAAREGTHRVTLTNNYYVGVYEVTQSQWSQVAGYNPSYFTTDRTMRPVEKVCYTDIRQGTGTAGSAGAKSEKSVSAAGGVYPAAPYGNSFLGLLRTKTGIDFDLPSEAQWEFAARAGNGDGHWSDGSTIQNSHSDANMFRLGRCAYNGGKIGSSLAEPAANCAVTNGTAIVGSYEPNDWGLYDMHGNVWEWCLDWYSDDITGIGGKVNIDLATPANTLSGNPVSGVNRAKKGGSWYYGAGYSRPAYRIWGTPDTRNYDGGLRVVCTAGLQ